MILSFRLRRTLKTYDIEAAVHSRLLAGILDVNIPTYELKLLSRDHSEYWNPKTIDGSRLGASWQNLNWRRKPIDEKMIQVHFSDRIKLPEASISFAKLIYYLGDLGLQTNPKGFWDLALKGLNVLPETCLVREIGEGNVEKPILVIAKPTIEHPGTLLLRFENKPSKTLRTDKDLGPDWIQVPTVQTTAEPIGPNEPTEGTQLNEAEAVQLLESHQISETTGRSQDKVDGELEEKREQENIEYVRIDRKGIVEKKLTTGATLPVLGLNDWFVYSMLASTAHGGHCEYNGRPFGFQISLGLLYLTREAVVKITPSAFQRIVSDLTTWDQFV